MTEATNIGARVVPALLVRDMAETLDFYGKLGFRLTGYYPKQSDPVWAEVQRDAVTLQFHTDAPSGTPPNPVCSGTFYLFPASVTGLAEELRGKVAFAWGPDVMDYGMREFAVQGITMTLYYLHHFPLGICLACQRDLVFPFDFVERRGWRQRRPSF